MCKYNLSEIICRLISLIIAGFIFPSYAEITLDGSLGTARTLAPTDSKYMIGADLGSRAGNNLFHSFGEFNINTGESATFTGPEQIENIIGRVTGDKHSFIDGALNSTIPNADLYFLNPNGVIMGPNATLDIDGAFHLSSSNYLQFDNGDRFEANTNSSLLSVASPEQFGFFNQMGDIKIVGGQLENGKIDFGEFDFGENDFSVTAGNLEIIARKIKSTTQDGQAGHILLQTAGSLKIIGSEIVSETQSGGQGSTGNITLNSPTIILDNHIEREGVNYALNTETLVGTRTFGAGEGGNVEIETSELLIRNSAIIAETKGIGSGGDIRLRLGELEIRENGRLSTTSIGQGHSGDINVMATNIVSILGNRTQNQVNTFLTADTQGQGNGGNIVISTPDLEIDAGFIQAATHDEGNAGNIRLEVDQFVLKNGGAIKVGSDGSGAAGNVDVVGWSNKYVNTLDIVGESFNEPSGIGSSAFAEGAGGTIRIAAQTLNLDKRGTIQTLTDGKGDAGDIRIDVHDLSITNGADIDASNEGNGYSKSGQIDIHATGNVLITAEPVLSEEVLASNRGFVYNNHLGGIYSIAKKTGHGGNITLSAGQLTLHDNGVISAKSTAYAGNAGNVNLNTNALHLEIGEAWIDVSSELGLNGEFILNSTKLKDPFLLLPTAKFQDAELSLDPCADLSIDNLSSFSIISRDVQPASPEELKTHFYLPPEM